MRGWFTVKDRFENELGQRFYKDTYGNKWLAFMDKMSTEELIFCAFILVQQLFISQLGLCKSLLT